MMDKHARLLELARLRQKTRWSPYRCIGDYHEGKYECDFVSPYTKSACNVDSGLMVLLQDWASDDVLGGRFLLERITVGHDPSRRTNQRLRVLLRRYFRLELEQVYATNVFPFVKLGRMDARIPRQDLVRAAREFALPQIEIVGPRLAVCLGKTAFNAVAVATDHRRAGSLADAIASPFEMGKTQVWCQAHLGRNAVDQVAGDWARMASAYKNAWSGSRPGAGISDVAASN